MIILSAAQQVLASPPTRQMPFDQPTTSLLIIMIIMMIMMLMMIDDHDDHDENYYHFDNYHFDLIGLVCRKIFFCNIELSKNCQNHCCHHLHHRAEAVLQFSVLFLETFNWSDENSYHDYHGHYDCRNQISCVCCKIFVENHKSIPKRMAKSLLLPSSSQNGSNL